MSNPTRRVIKIELDVTELRDPRRVREATMDVIEAIRDLWNCSTDHHKARLLPIEVSNGDVVGTATVVLNARVSPVTRFRAAVAKEEAQF